MNKLCFLCLLLWGSVLTHHVEAQLPELLQAALRAPDPVPQYRHTVFIQEDDFTGRARIDPAKPAGQRVSIIDSSLEADDPELLRLIADADNEPMDGFWCHDLAELVPDRVDEIDRTEKFVTYRFAPAPGDDSNEDDLEFMKNLMGEIEVHRASRSVSSLRLYAPKSFRISLAVKVQHFEMNAHCEFLGAGSSRLVESSTHVKARALFKRLEQLEVKRITDVERVN